MGGFPMENIDNSATATFVLNGCVSLEVIG